MRRYAYEGDSEEDAHFSMEIVTSWDEKVTTLICRSSIKLSSVDYAHALREFANHIEERASLDSSVVN